MQEPYLIIKESFEKFNGTGAFFWLYLCALVYMYIKSEKSIKDIFLLPFIIYVILAFNPFSISIISEMIGSVYWRMIWIMPIAAAMSYVCADIVYLFSEKLRRIAITVVLILLIVVSGKFIFTGENFQIAENWYKLPKETIAVVDSLTSMQDKNPKVVLPPELAITARQYNSDIRILYGRDILSRYAEDPEYITKYYGEIKYIIDVLYKSVPGDINILREFLNKYGVQYVVIDNSIYTPIANFDLPLIDSEFQYNIYKNT